EALTLRLQLRGPGSGSLVNGHGDLLAPPARRVSWTRRSYRGDPRRRAPLDKSGRSLDRKRMKTCPHGIGRLLRLPRPDEEGGVSSTDVARLQDQALQHLWLHFTAMQDLPPEKLQIITRGEGPYVYDQNGRRVLDFLSGLFTVQIGYSYGEELGEAMLEQARELPYYTNWTYAHPCSIELAAK